MDITYLDLARLKRMSPQAYLGMKNGTKMTVTIDTTEIIFKDGSSLLVWYDPNKNIPLIDGCNNDYVTEIVYIPYKYVTDTKILNLG